MSRRSNGEGSYTTLPSGKTRLRVALADGTRLSFTGTSREDCFSQYRTAIAKHPDGHLVTSSRASVGEWLDQWLEDHIQPNTSESPRTYEAYESAVRLRLKPELGRVQLGKLSGVHIQRAYARLATRYAPKSLNFTHNVLHLSLEAARRLRLISHNPTEDVTPPKRPDGHAGERALSREQLQVLDAAIAGHDYEPIWRFLLGTGVRWGEAASLRWSDVDLTPGREQVTIARAATRVRGNMLVKAPKTRKGRRTIPLAPDTVAALDMQRTRVLWLRKRAEEFGLWSDVDGDLVFPNQHGRLLRSNNPLAAFKKVLFDAGLPPKRLHDLRHTYATLLFARDVHPRIAQDLLGHTRIDMTMDLYTGSVPEAAREAVARLSDVFSRSS
ncbi:MAG TPA: site-specific integrase [Chloroflexota bacterium]|nr:site-specific integrase [Chloroflexota bacterium]